VHEKKAEIEIVVGDIVIRAGRGIDEGHLSRVIRAVRAAV
jgi:transposase